MTNPDDDKAKLIELVASLRQELRAEKRRSDLLGDMLQRAERAPHCAIIGKVLEESQSQITQYFRLAETRFAEIISKYETQLAFMLGQPESICYDILNEIAFGTTSTTLAEELPALLEYYVADLDALHMALRADIIELLLKCEAEVYSSARAADLQLRPLR